MRFFFCVTVCAFAGVAFTLGAIADSVQTMPSVVCGAGIAGAFFAMCAIFNFGERN